MKLFLSLLLLIAGIQQSLAQNSTSFSATILDEKGAPMAFVNVGIPGCSGTVTDMQGVFTLTTTECNVTDTIRISMLGYKTLNFNLQEAQKNYSNKFIQMKKSEYALKEVGVKSSRMKNHEKGNFNQADNMQAGFKSNDLGSEVVVKIKCKSDAWIKKFNFYITRSIFDTLFFRLNVYEMKEGVPGKNILSHPIYVTTTSKNGWNSVNLEKYNIVADGDFAIGLEWIRNLRNGDVSQGLFFSAAFFNKECFYRKASQQAWKNIPSIGIGFNVTVAE